MWRGTLGLGPPCLNQLIKNTNGTTAASTFLNITIMNGCVKKRRRRVHKDLEVIVGLGPEVAIN